MGRGLPRVARGSQPWAGGRNPFGIERATLGNASSDFGFRLSDFRPARPAPIPKRLRPPAQRAARRATLGKSIFGFRISPFGFPSDFGFRPSDFRPTPPQPLGLKGSPATHTRQYPRSTSALPPFYLRSTSVCFTEVEPWGNGGGTEVERRYHGERVGGRGIQQPTANGEP